jgi:carbon-monoxide dehydrogenase medium subunit
MNSFEYSRPASLEEAAAVMQDNPDAVFYAGGTDILVRFKQGLITPPLLVDLKKVPELSGVTPIGEYGLRLGAMTSLSELIENPLVAQRCPVLSQAAASMACVQVRNRATLGGNLANASPSADTAPALIVHDAEIEIFSGGKTRRVPLAEFFTGPGETVMEKGDILIAVHIPDIQRKAHYIKHTLRRAMDIAAVGVALSRRAEGDPDPRLVLGAVAPTPLRVPQAEVLLERGEVEKAAQAAAEAAKPIDDVRSSAEYRREVIAPLVKRLYRIVFK